MFWLSDWSWSVLALFETSVLADEFAVCEAELGPEFTLPPATLTGTFAFTAFWSLFAAPAASWLVWAFWIPAWNPPAPPQPARQLEPPMFCPSRWFWSVLEWFETSVLADELAFWSAELEPE